MTTTRIGGSARKIEVLAQGKRLTFISSGLDNYRYVRRDGEGVLEIWRNGVIEAVFCGSWAMQLE